MKLFGSATLPAIVAGCACSWLAGSAATPNFNADIRSGGNPATANLTINGSAAALTTDIWFVADKSGTGLNIGPEGSAVLETTVASWLSQVGDDVLIFEDAVPGALLPTGSNAGKFQRLNRTIDSVSLDLNFNDNRATGNPGPFPTKVYAILWSDSTGGGIGDTFAIGEVTGLTIPTTLNPQWIIPAIDLTFSSGVSDYIVVAVPEPSTYALLALGGLGAFAYRRFRRQ